MKNIEIVDWRGAYGKSWVGTATRASIIHPAKFSRRLIAMIYRDMLERNLLSCGNTVLDPFGGVALGALDAMTAGLNWVGFEIEPKYYALGNGADCPVQHAGARQYVCETGRSFDESHVAHHVVGNIEAWNALYSGKTPNWGSARMVLADARTLQEHLDHEVDGVITSPPYASIVVGAGGLNTKPPRSEGDVSSGRSPSSPSQMADKRYGSAGGQMARMGMRDFESRNDGLSSGGFWHASKAVMAGCAAVLKPGAWGAWVVKNFVRNGSVVPFDEMWMQLCSECGLEPKRIARAWQYEVVSSQVDASGNVTVKTVTHKGFFRREHEKKTGLRIDWESVIFAQRRPV